MKVSTLGETSPTVPGVEPEAELKMMTLPRAAVVDRALLNVTVTMAFKGTWIAWFAGEIEMTYGGVRSAVVK